MTPSDFRNLLDQAIARDADALEKILDLYEPLINKYSWLDGRVDEDLRQHLLLYIALNISRFQI